MIHRAALRGEDWGAGAPSLRFLQGWVLPFLCRERIFFWDIQLLLPAAAEGLIDLYQGEEFVETGLRQAEFRGEVVCLVGEDF